MGELWVCGARAWTEPKVFGSHAEMISMGYGATIRETPRASRQSDPRAKFLGLGPANRNGGQGAGGLAPLLDARCRTKVEDGVTAEGRGEEDPCAAVYRRCLDPLAPRGVEPFHAERAG